METLLRLVGACSSHGLLTAQLLFSVAFVSSCELPNWLVGPREVNGCLERRMTVSALFFPSGLRNGAGAAGTARGIAQVAAGAISRSKRGLLR
jgi:hypothetical protein